MKTADKIYYAVGTIVPIIYWLGSSFIYNDRDLYMSILDILNWSLVALMTVIYVLSIFNNHSLSHEAKIFWSVLLLTMSLFPMIYYWYKYILRGERGRKRLAFAEKELGGISSLI